MRLLAKEIVASRRTVARLHENKAQMNSVSMMLTEQLATVRSVGHLEKSTEVLSAMNGLVRNADVRDSMREMSKEMAKSGLIEELVNDALEDINGVDDLEAETDAEVNKILAELAGETAVAMPAPSARASRPKPSPPSPNRVCALRCNERRPSTICRRDWTPYARWRKPAENVLIKTSPSIATVSSPRTSPRIVCDEGVAARRRSGETSRLTISAPEARRWLRGLHGRAALPALCTASSARTRSAAEDSFRRVASAICVSSRRVSA